MQFFLKILSYQGYDKRDGNYIAIKSINKKNNRAEYEKEFEKEINAYKSIGKHENIVNFFGVEIASSNGIDQKIIAFELCSEGSLLDVIRQPENKFGLSENEFCCFLKDLTNGIKYLRQRDLLHRDIKPGNIMKTILDGRTIYKLADMGTVKKISDDTNFGSIVGTNEYVSPEIFYNHYMGHTEESKIVKATSDLYSIGITLYHVLTGNIPFRAVLGTKTNNHTHFHMKNKKPADAIAGIQVEFLLIIFFF